MPKKFTDYWYRTHTAVAEAFLFHCRDRDLRTGPGISKGSIVQGAIGFAITERDVPDLAGTIVPRFFPNRRCEWKGFTLGCMAHQAAPHGAPKSKLRYYNNVVCDVTNSPAIRVANELGIPIIKHVTGLSLVNLEVSVFGKQGVGNPRRAKLV